MGDFFSAVTLAVDSAVSGFLPASDVVDVSTLADGLFSRLDFIASAVWSVAFLLGLFLLGSVVYLIVRFIFRLISALSSLDS